MKPSSKSGGNSVMSLAAELRLKVLGCRDVDDVGREVLKRVAETALFA